MAGKILIADDSLKIQQQLTEMLKSADIEIVAVSNGEYAVRKLPEAKPDLVLADIFMPVRTGYEVCEFIKTSEEYSQIPVLLLASTLEPYDEEEAARVQSDGKIEKPFADPAATLATIKQHLDKALSSKPAEPVVSADEFAAAVPETEKAQEAEPEPEAAPDVGEETLIMTPEPAPELQPSDEPTGFADMMEQESAEPEPAAPEPVAAEEDIPFAAAAALEESPAETATEPEAAAPAEEPPAPELEKEPAPREVEKAELAAPWEMTKPPEGAPEIPTAGPVVEEEKTGAAPEETAAPEEPAAVEKAEAPTKEAPAEPATASEADTAQPFPPEEFAAAFGSETEEAPAEPATEPATEPEPAAAATTAPSEAGPGSIDKMVEEIAKKVVEQLSPEVMESLAKEMAKEIAKPLAEKIVKKKLIE